MASSSDRLTRLQRLLLEAFFRAESRFFLTGGAALAGFYLHHRQTLDLDLFTLDPAAFETGRRALDAAAAELGATVAVRQHAPGFERYVVTGGGESVVVDLVLERVPQTSGAKHLVGSIAVDPLEEIFINKVTTILSRAEERDLVDLLFLERHGLKIETPSGPPSKRMAAARRQRSRGCWQRCRFPTASNCPAACRAPSYGGSLPISVVRLRRAAFPASETH